MVFNLGLLIIILEEPVITHTVCVVQQVFFLILYVRVI